jgi:hypothetical protein
MPRKTKNKTLKKIRIPICQKNLREQLLPKNPTQVSPTTDFELRIATKNHSLDPSLRPKTSTAASKNKVCKT